MDVTHTRDFNPFLAKWCELQKRPESDRTQFGTGKVLNSISKSFPPVHCSGVNYSFEHLAPRNVVIAGEGREGGDIVVRISFKSHVFSKSLPFRGEEFDFRDENDQKRSFCLTRYRASLTLAQTCEDLLVNNAPTWESRDRNRKSNLAIVEAPLVSGEHYAIFYYFFPSRKDGVDVEMVVKSAFKKYIDFSRIKRRYKMKQRLKECYYKNKTVP